MKRIVIFASGSGTNAENIIRYFKNNQVAEVALVLSNKQEAGVFHRAKHLDVPAVHFTKQQLTDEQGVLKTLLELKPDLIILAGFLLKFPKSIIQHFPNKVVNIHPALLPKYGGKGMYGNFVHQAVIDAKELESGISIHFVNEAYDEGAVIFQKSVPITTDDTPDTLAEKIHKLEYEWFPKVIEELLTAPAST